MLFYPEKDHYYNVRKLIILLGMSLEIFIQQIKKFYRLRNENVVNFIFHFSQEKAQKVAVPRLAVRLALRNVYDGAAITCNNSAPGGSYLK
jgi:hypothetical protein